MLVISFVLAAASAFFVPISGGYVDYIDFRTLALLLCLMLVMAGLNGLGVFSLMANAMLKKAGSVRSFGLILCLLCFFSSMLITNDVALITFVPFTVIALKMSGSMSELIKLVTLETVAANLGSMATPVGNPQNLYLFSAFEMELGEFFLTLAPYTVLSLVLIIAFSFVFKKGEIKAAGIEQNESPDKLRLIIYALLFVLALLTVFRVVHFAVTLIVTLAAVLVFDRKTLLKADYSLLLTFVFLFIFIGNLGQVDAVSNMLRTLVSGNEVPVGIAASQVFSNVPAAILLSGFSNDVKGLLVGVNLGGLGTLIASMASLISFKLIAKEDVSKGRYMLVFTAVNIVFLVFNIVLWLIIR